MKYLLIAIAALSLETEREAVGRMLREAEAARQVAVKAEAQLKNLIEETRHQADVVVKAKDEAERLEQKADAALAAYLDGLQPDPVPKDDLEQYLDSLPFAAEIPEMPEYAVPTEQDCDWIFEGGTFTSRRGLDAATTPRDAFRASRAAGDDTVTIGVRGTMGKAVVGGQWNGDSGHSMTDRAPSGDWATDLSVEIVGLTGDAEVNLGWSSRYGYVERIAAFDIGLRGASDSFVIRANDPVGTVILDGCWFLPHIREDGSPQNHASGLHMDKWEVAVLRRTKWRGKQPGSPGINLREHVFYLKSSRGQTWIVENDLKGGNRTGFQIRPQRTQNKRPVGPVVIAKNVADGYGWNHGMSGGSFDGGSAITVWSNPDGKTFIAGNRITDAKYGCLMLGGQVQERNWLNKNGFPIKTVWVWDNVFENSQQGRPGNLPKRGACSVTAAELVHWGPNELQRGAVLTINNEWGMEHHGIEVDEFRAYDPGFVDDDVRTYENGATRSLTETEKQELLVD